MRRWLVTLVLFTGACAAPPSVPYTNPGDGQVTVMVFNIHAGKDAAGSGNLDAVATLARDVGADVVLLQEVDRLTKRSGNVDQIKVLADQTGFAFAFGRSLDYDGGQYGIATLAREGVQAYYIRELPVRPTQTRSGGSHEPRAALVAMARTPLGSLITLNTHLDASREETYRLQEVTHVLEAIRRSADTGMPIVAGGDFNAEPGGEVHKRLLAAGLRDSWLECGAGDGLTYPADKPVKRIDYLFLTGSLRCRSARVIDTRISDHRPLLVTVR